MNNISERHDKGCRNLMERLHEEAAKAGTTVTAVEALDEGVIAGSKVTWNFKVTWADGSTRGASVTVDNDRA